MSLKDNEIQDDLELLLHCLPPRVVKPLHATDNLSSLLEIILDVGRPPEARFYDSELLLDPAEVTQEDLDYVTTRVSEFGSDNRSGIERTLHRISAIRNRKGRILGLTCRVGRAVYGTIQIIEDIVFSGKSVLLLGRPGVGKSTMLREIARVLADTAKKRVIVVDTSNEIAGDGDIPHPAIGHARRMQVPTPTLQHSVMIEAVENHMPQVIIIDEMGTELEATAARTIAERGVQLIATAHGNTLDNLIMNPTLADLIGGIHSVTLGDDEARYRGTQKTVLERKAPPTFDAIVEIHNWDTVAVHDNLIKVVDSWLRGFPANPELRWKDSQGSLLRSRSKNPPAKVFHNNSPAENEARGINHVNNINSLSNTQIFLFGIGRDKLEQASANLELPINIVNELRTAKMILTTKSHYKRGSRVVHLAEQNNIPVHVIRKNSIPQIEQFLKSRFMRVESKQSLETALEEAHKAAQSILIGEKNIDLATQNAYTRRLQHMIANEYQISSMSSGVEPNRHVRLMQMETS